jgi:hypothetical protein
MPPPLPRNTPRIEVSKPFFGFNCLACSRAAFCFGWHCRRRPPKTHEWQPIGDKQKGSEWTGFLSLQLVRLRSARARKRLRRRQMQALLRRQISDLSAAGMRILCSIVSSSTNLRSQASLHPENRTFFSYPRCECLRGGRATASATTGSRASAASSPTIKRTAKKQIWSEIGRASAGAAIVCAPQRVAAEAVTWKQVRHVFVA